MSSRGCCSCTTCATSSASPAPTSAATRRRAAPARSVNGESVKRCTVLAVQADGADIITIEGLANGDELHPMQEAFRENHGLQCGFCTPGMVMAAVGLLNENPNPTEREVREGLEGNLCRCTGYHNIVQGRAARPPRPGGAGMIPAAFDYVRAGSADEAIALLAEHGDDAKLLAGGHSPAAADEAAAGPAGGARRHRPPQRPVVHPRRRRPHRHRRADPPPRPRDVRPAAARRCRCSPTPPARSATRRCATAARSAARSPTPTRRPTCPAVAARARRRRIVAQGPQRRRARSPPTDFFTGLPRDGAGARRAAHRDPRAEGRRAPAGRSRSSTGGPRTGRSSASPRCSNGTTGIAPGQHGLDAAARHRGRAGARRRRVGRRRGRSTPPRAPSRRPTSTPASSTASTSPGCSCAGPSRKPAPDPSERQPDS